MMIDPARMDWPRLVPFAILAASIGALIIAYTAELAFGIEPCILCLYQRIPYALAGALAVAALLAPETWGPRPKMWAVIGAAVAFLAGAEIAFYHVGVEQHWWQGTEECVGTTGATTLAELEAQIMASPLTRCDEVSWSLFGISMAGHEKIGLRREQRFRGQLRHVQVKGVVGVKVHLATPQ
jgi:disulfide bond formation protein DsbB